MSYFESAKARQIITLSAIVVLFIFLFISLSNFIPSFLGALVLFIIFSPMMNYLSEKHKLKKSLSAIIIILLSMVIVLVPIITFTDILVVKLKSILSGNTLFQEQLQHVNALTMRYMNINLISAENMALVQKKTAEVIPNLLNQTISAFLSLGIMY